VSNEPGYGQVKAAGLEQPDGRLPTKKGPNMTHGDHSVGYGAVHGRLTRKRGKASGADCIICGPSANHRASSHAEPYERIDPQCRPDSTDLGRFIPMCGSCHTRFDRVVVSSARKTRKAKKPKVEKPIRRRRRPHCIVCGRPVMCGQGDSHYECRPRCVNCGQPAGICLPDCPLPAYPFEAGR
jgi:hypothetical protein